MDRVYIVERRTWTSKEIVDVFRDESDARAFADEKENSKQISDGYNEYYVIEFLVK